MSMFTSALATVLSVAHHTTVLVLSYKETTGPFQTSHIPHVLPAMAKRGAVVCLWLLAVVWLCVSAVSCVLCGLVEFCVLLLTDLITIDHYLSTFAYTLIIIY